MKPSGLRVSCRLFVLRFFVVAFALCSGVVAQAQEIMTVNQALVFSKDSTLISVDAKGGESKSEAMTASSDDSGGVSANIRRGGRIEVSGGTSAQLIISEAVTAHLEPGTQIEIPKLVEGKKPTTSLKLLKGKMFITVDAAKLKKDGNVEFRLETPKSLLAVRGTKFVATTGAEADTVALVEGSLAVRDQATKEFAILSRGQSTSVSGEGKLLIRPFTADESNYSAVFDESQLVLVPYEIESDSLSSGETKILTSGQDPDRPASWISTPKIFRGKLIKFDGFSTKGLRVEYVPNKPYLTSEVRLQISFSAKRLKINPENIIGVLIKLKSTAPNNSPTLHMAAMVNDGFLLSVYRDIPKTDPTLDQDIWTTHFAWDVSHQADPPSQHESYKGNVVNQLILFSHKIQADGPIPPFILEIASIQIVTLGSEKK